ncbi:hypothetical protein KIF59_00400 [Enterobacter cloacae subsp. cloacae]|nr:hypothetical protein [Enterobacter cloacae subsp. cloacae]
MALALTRPTFDWFLGPVGEAATGLCLKDPRKSPADTRARQSRISATATSASSSTERPAVGASM